jgi:hypothetical protein
MTRQEIEEIAIQAGIKSYALGMATEEAWQQTERFVELILKKGEESMKELSKEQILEAYKSLASSPRYRLSELEIFTMAVRWMEEQNKKEEDSNCE